MPIVTPDQGFVDLTPSRGSRIQTQDTYARPAIPQDNGDLDTLARALNKFGANVSAYGAERAAKDEAEQLRNVEYYKSIAGDIKAGTPVMAQLDQSLSAVSPTVRARVAEAIGIDHGQAYWQERSSQLFNDPEMINNPEKVQAALGALKAEVAEKVRGQPGYGTGFLKAVERFADDFANSATSERNKAWAEYQGKQYDWNLINGLGKIRNDAGNLRYATVAEASGGKPQEKFANLYGVLGNSRQHLDNLNAQFASRLDTMIADAPPEIRAQLKVISGYRSTERQAELYQQALAKWGSPEKARKWVAPPGHSNHNHGEAIDFNGGAALKNTPAGQWLHANAEKYGLYFPMENEPWHIEMRGGRREKGAPSKVQLADGTVLRGVGKADGHDDINETSWRAKRIIGIESSGNPNAQSASSTAGGLGGYTNSTWVERISKHRPDLVAGKDEASILALKKDGRIAQEVLQKDVAGYEKIIRDKGLPESDGAVWLMHFAGTTGGEKVLKANDGTSVETVLGAKAVQANPWLKGMTVGELKQTAEEKMGNASTAVAKSRNFIRQQDRVMSVSSSLDNEMRRERVSKLLYKQAVATQDTSWLDQMPDELHSNETRAAFQVARREIVKAQRAEQEFQRQQKVQEDYNVGEQLRDAAFQRLVKGEEFNIVEAATDPRTGRVREDVLEKISKAKQAQLHVDPFKSKLAADRVQDEIAMASATGNWSKLIPGVPDGENPTARQVKDFLVDHPEMRTDEKMALIGKVEQTMQQYVILRSPEVNEAYSHTVGADVQAASQDLLTSKLGPLMGPMGLQLASKTRDAFNNSLRRQFKAHIEKYGSPPTVEKEAMYKLAAEEARHVLLAQKALISAGKDKPGVPPAITGGATMVPLPDGKNLIVPNAPTSQNQQTPPLVQLASTKGQQVGAATGATAAPTEAPAATPAAQAAATPTPAIPPVNTPQPGKREQVLAGMNPAERSAANREQAAQQSPPVKLEDIGRAVQKWAQSGAKDIQGFFRQMASDVNRGAKERKIDEHLSYQISNTPALKAEFDQYEQRIKSAKSKKEEQAVGSELSLRYKALREEFLANNDIDQLPAKPGPQSYGEAIQQNKRKR